MINTIFVLIILFFSIVIHEIAHGSIALSLGDPTAKEADRLTLNPLKHIDPLGTIFLPLFLLILTLGKGPIFGWAKPVPINPYNFRNPKWGNLKVAIAGPGTNFLLAITFGLLIKFFTLPPLLSELFSIIVIYNFAWGIFNLIPIPPFDGSWILFSFLPPDSNLKIFLQRYSLFILIFFIFFGLQFVFLGAQFLYSFFIS